jgi:hypothetical protein
MASTLMNDEDVMGPEKDFAELRASMIRLATACVFTVECIDRNA